MTFPSDPDRPERKIVGIASMGNALKMIVVVLCDDGTMWWEDEVHDFHQGTRKQWRRYYTAIPRSGEEDARYR